LDPVEVRLFGERPDEAIPLNDYLAQAYQLAGEFCELVGKRARGAGFLKTLLLRRLGSTIVAGRITANKMLQDWEHVTDEDDSEEEAITVRADFKTLSPEEQDALEKFVRVLEMNRARDPKYEVVVRLLREGHAAAGPESWLQLGCIIFSQYYDSVEWLARELSTNEFPQERIGVYAGAGKSAIYTSGVRQAEEREALKQMVRTGEIRLIIGTDAASEGLNLQRLGTLINLDLPWNPTRLEQRKGRIQRIGQKRDRVFVYNMRYLGSVEDRVHELLSSRLRDIHNMFGQIPDTLEDVWIDVAVGTTEKAKERIGAIPKKHPFEAKYNQIANVDWESCAEVLNSVERRNKLAKPW
jgi:superfamily II DNA/RNA helicase